MPELAQRLDHREERPKIFSTLQQVHHIDLPRALGTNVLPREITKEHVAQLRKFLASEKWPYTSQGLYGHLKEIGLSDVSLVQAFCLTEEYQLLERLFSQSPLPVTRKDVLELICEGTWETLQQFTQRQKASADFSDEARKALLERYKGEGSAVAARLYVRPGEGQLRPAFREPVPAAPSPKKHIVEPGESLWLIAEKHGVSLESLMQLNGLQSTTIRQGQTLKLP